MPGFKIDGQGTVPCLTIHSGRHRRNTPLSIGVNPGSSPTVSPGFSPDHPRLLRASVGAEPDPCLLSWHGLCNRGQRGTPRASTPPGILAKIFQARYRSTLSEARYPKHVIGTTLSKPGPGGTPENSLPPGSGVRPRIGVGHPATPMPQSPYP